MAMKLILMGYVNLMDVTNPEEPFRKILGELHAADVVFGNLECCLHLPASRQSDANEGFFADPVVGGEALKLACIHAVGIANNVPVELYKGAANLIRSWQSLFQDWPPRAQTRELDRNGCRSVVRERKVRL